TGSAVTGPGTTARASPGGARSSSPTAAGPGTTARPTGSATARALADGQGLAERRAAELADGHRAAAGRAVELADGHGVGGGATRPPGTTAGATGSSSPTAAGPGTTAGATGSVTARASLTATGPPGRARRRPRGRRRGHLFSVIHGVHEGAGQR